MQRAPQSAYKEHHNQHTKMNQNRYIVSGKNTAHGTRHTDASCMDAPGGDGPSSTCGRCGQNQAQVKTNTHVLHRREPGQHRGRVTPRQPRTLEACLKTNGKKRRESGTTIGLQAPFSHIAVTAQSQRSHSHSHSHSTATAQPQTVNRAQPSDCKHHSVTSQSQRSHSAVTVTVTVTAQPQHSYRR